MTTRIVVLTAQDIALIMPVMTTAFDRHYREAWTDTQVEAALAVPGTRLIAARRADEIIGFALFRTLFEVCELLLIAVRPECRGQSVGATLMESVICMNRAEKVQKLFLEMRVTNSAKGFYQRYQFKVVGERLNYYRSCSGESINALTMSVDIA
jgi:ribosomal-protein-alanine N-acetyltransferase